MKYVIYIDTPLHWVITKQENTLTAVCTRIGATVIADTYPNLFAAMDSQTSTLFTELYKNKTLNKYIYDHGIAIQVMEYQEKYLDHTPTPVIIEN